MSHRIRRPLGENDRKRAAEAVASMEPVACHRCRRLDPERAHLDGWTVLDAREDGWALFVCPDCQSPVERERAALLLLEP